MPPLHLWLARWVLPLIEAALVIPIFAMILLRRRKRPQPSLTEDLERMFGRFARRRALSVVAVGLLCLGLRVALLPILGVPEPSAHDEFSYMLAADTFAHGRLTNPPHPLWIHFESFHINQQPTYMSMYPPGQGLILALGMRLGHPWIGILLATALLCSAICWMLQGWLPPAWALLGGVLAILRLGLLSYWMNSYWGGSLAAFGGALVLGALPRLRRNANSRDALLMALGLAILANTRPYEGLALSLPVALILFSWMVREKRFPVKIICQSVVAPIALVLLLTMAAIGGYDRKVTGSAFRLPYAVNAAAYSSFPPFLWQTARPVPLYHHAVMRNFYTRWREDYEESRTLRGFWGHTMGLKVRFWIFFLGSALTIALLSFPFVLYDRRMRAPLLIGAVFLLALSGETWIQPHYFAPATA